MLIEEDVKSEGEINPDALAAVFEDEVLIEEEVTIVTGDDDEGDEIDIAFLANDEGYW